MAKAQTVTFRLTEEDMLDVYKICRLTNTTTGSPSTATKEAFSQLRALARKRGILPAKVDLRDGDEEWVLKKGDQYRDCLLEAVEESRQRLEELDRKAATEPLTILEREERKALYTKYYPGFPEDEL